MPNFESLPEGRMICKLSSGPPESEKLVSVFVNIFSEHLKYATDFLIKAWEEGLGTQIGDEVGKGGPINARHPLIQFKVMHDEASLFKNSIAQNLSYHFLSM